MSFTDNLKKSLGFEEEYNSSFGLRRSLGFEEEPAPDFDVPDYGLRINSEFDEEYLEDFTISPEQPFYEIILIKPKSMDDMDYVFDQIIEEGNPVILDLIFLQKKGINDYIQAGEKLRLLRKQYNAHAILLSKTNDKNLILVSPSRVKIANKS